MIDLMEDHLVRSCHDYKGSAAAGTLMAGLKRDELLGKKRAQNTHSGAHPNSGEDQWMMIGRSVFRIHARPRLTLFHPRSVPDCPVAIEELDTTRHTWMQSEGTNQVTVDKWSEASRCHDTEWTGCTHFFLKNKDGDTDGTHQSSSALFDPVFSSALMPLPFTAHTKSFSILDSVSHVATAGECVKDDSVFSDDLRNGQNLSDHLRTGSDLSQPPSGVEPTEDDSTVDFWDWSVTDMARRCHINVRKELWQEKPELHFVAPFAIHIRDNRFLDESHHPGGVHIQMYRWDTDTLPVLSEPWKGETWFWSTHLTKREIFRNILKHSFCSISPQRGNPNLFLTMSISKCATCWSIENYPPHLHQRTHGIPTHKGDLISALQNTALIRKEGLTTKGLEQKTVVELRHLYKEAMGRTIHPQCPVQRLTTLHRNEMLELAAKHGLTWTHKVQGRDFMCSSRSLGGTVSDGRQQLLPPCPKANPPVKTMAQPTQPPRGLTHAPVTGKKGRTADGPWEFVDSTPMEGTPPEEVLQEINYVEQIAQEAMTRAAVLRQSHGLAPKTHHMAKGSSPKK